MTTTRIRRWRVAATAGAAVPLLAVMLAVPAGASDAPDASHANATPAEVLDGALAQQADVPHLELVTDCFGEPVSLATVMYVPDTSPWTYWFYGTPGDDVIIGTSNFDMIDGGGGNDTICGYQEGDRLVGGEGADHIDGGGGYDDVIGDEGDDVLYGSAGGDALFGGEGSDDLYGELGDEYFDCGTTGTDLDYAEEGDGVNDFVIDCEVFVP